MRFGTSLSLLASTLFVGCAAPPDAPLSTDHPAHPSAAEAPAAPRSRTLAHTTETDAPAPASAAHDHQHHATAGAGAAIQYTCPHHPEVISTAPGDCPKCGMKLDPAPSTQPARPPQHNHTHDLDASHEGHGGQP